MRPLFLKNYLCSRDMTFEKLGVFQICIGSHIHSDIFSSTVLMASKLLDRLRRSIFKEGELHVDTDDTDDFPESSELEDDTDNVSSRLSGTLCFDGDGVLDSEDAGETSGPDSDLDCFPESIDNACGSTGSS